MKFDWKIKLVIVILVLPCANFGLSFITGMSNFEVKTTYEIIEIYEVSSTENYIFLKTNSSHSDENGLIRVYKRPPAIFIDENDPIAKAKWKRKHFWNPITLQWDMQQLTGFWDNEAANIYEMA